MKCNEILVTKAGLGNFARLRDAAKAVNKDVTLVTRKFALEAAIRRIFASEHADRFGVASLKGGSLMFLSEGVDPIHARATKDVDLQLGQFDGTVAELKEILRDALASVPATDDGARFDVEGLNIEAIRDGGVPGGTLETTVQIGRAVVKFRVDVGFYSMEDADVLEDAVLPSLLPGLEPIKIRRQPVEYSIADKLHAAARKGMGNSRLRDFYDMYVFSTRCQLDDDRLEAALRRVFPLYADAPMPASWDEIPAYTDEYVQANAPM